MPRRSPRELLSAQSAAWPSQAQRRLVSAWGAIKRLKPEGAWEVAGVTAGVAPGFYTNSRAGILTYDPEQCYTSDAFVRVPELTVFGNVKLWIRHSLWVVYMIALAALATFVPGFNDSVGAKMLGLADRTQLEFRFLTAVLLGSFVNRCLGAWKERRTGYASIASTDELRMMLRKSFLVG